MAGGAPFDLRLQHEGMQKLLRAIREEEDGKQLRKDLAKNLRETLKPAAEQAKSGIMSMSSSGKSDSRPALRPAIAKRIRPEVKLGGRWTGARVKARKTPNVRNFANAPKRTQSRKGWRTRSWGHPEAWRTQRGRVDWFDRAMAADAAQYRAAAQQALEDMAARIAARAR